MALIKKKQVVENDPWTSIADDADLPAEGDIVVGLARYQAESAALAARGGRVGVRVDPTDDVAALADLVDDLDLITVNFPKFADGRGYSKARLLRDRLGYRGELRAVGQVLSDQLAYMTRCGIDAFELVDGKNIDNALACLDHLTVHYQGAADDPRPLYRRRG